LKTGKRRVFSPIKVFVSHKKTETDPIKFLVLVPKKNIRSAVKRNRVKRVIREVWRVNKKQILILAKEKNINLMVAFLYLEKAPPDYNNLKKNISDPLEFLKKYISNIE
jgi:ribonuclease P protein component